MPAWHINAPAECVTIARLYPPSLRMALHYQSAGHGEPLVLLHGLFGSGDNWASLANTWSAHYQVIRVDLRNHGRSPHHATHGYAEMAADVLALCDHLNLPSIHLLGHSMGGKVAMQFAGLYPQRLRSLVVVDMAMRAYADTHTPLIDAMLAVNPADMTSRSRVDQALKPAIPDIMVRQFLLTNLVKVNDHLQWRLNLTALRDNYPQLLAALHLPTSVTQPAMFIRGEHSDYLLPADMVNIQQTFPHARCISLPAGHWVHAEQPQLFSQAVSDFLAAAMPR